VQREGRIRPEFQRYQERAASLYQIMRHKGIVAATYESLIGLVTNAGVALGVWQAANLVLQQSMSAGSLVSFFIIVDLVRHVCIFDVLLTSLLCFGF
jgi:ABC-type bacteriocin/lantibiotic exporter with double-glycine peptidase domain